MRVRLLRGQIVVREVHGGSRLLWTPRAGRRQIHTHLGLVLGIGPGAELGGVAQPVAFAVGDIVGWHWEHNEDAFTLEWPEDGRLAIWIPHRCVDYVCEEYGSLDELRFTAGAVLAGPSRLERVLS